ncbi:MAG: GNAT family N-acetyltransferase [Methylotenera sp.]|nr:GNAT family N-acetyltransferase [Methylotenera sp.]
MNGILEIVKVSKRWKTSLKEFIKELDENGDSIFFAPHAVDSKTLDMIADKDNKDLHYLLVEGENILGYGLLRGWNEGYEIPSLGIAISPKARGNGLAKMLMQFLHIAALRKFSSKVRLRVLKSNAKAIKLYQELGYSFEEDLNDVRFLVGYKTIA